MSQPEKRYMDEVAWRKVGGKVGDIYIRPDQSYCSLNVDNTIFTFFESPHLSKNISVGRLQLGFGEHCRSPQTCVIKRSIFQN